MAGKFEIMIKCSLCTKMKYCNNKLRRLELAGHEVRMYDYRTVKKSDGRRKAGRPKLR